MTDEQKADVAERMGRRLIMCVGLPRAGKTTWTRSQSHPIVSPDSIRLAMHGQAFAGAAEPMVWMMADYFVRSLFLAGHDKVILDATNINEFNRRRWMSTDWVRQFKIFGTDGDVCRRRALDDSREDLLPVIDGMEERLVFPTYLEYEEFEIEALGIAKTPEWEDARRERFLRSCEDHIGRTRRIPFRSGSDLTLGI